MSQENAEIVRRVYEGWARGDFTGGDAFHPDIRFEMPDWPEGTTAHGLEAMRDAWQEVLGAWDDFRAEPQEFIEAGDQVLVLNHVHARGKGSGMEVDADTATLWTIDAGKVVRLSLYWDTAKALQAAGLSE